MIQIYEALYNKGKILADNIDIPDNSKVLIVWDSREKLKKSDKKLHHDLPKGIILNKNKGEINELMNLPDDAVDFQRKIRDNEWN